MTSIAFCLVVLFGEARLRGHANYTRVSHGARRASSPTSSDAATSRSGRLRTRWSRSARASPSSTLIDWFSKSSDAALSMASENSRICCRRASPRSSSASPPLSWPWPSHFPVALLAVRYSGPAVTILERATYLSFALPDLVGAIALAYAASHYLRFAYGSFALLVFAEAMLFLPFAVVALRATLGQLERVAGGVAPVARLRRARELLAGDDAARHDRARRGRGAGLRLDTQRSLDQRRCSSAGPATRSGPSFRPTARP